ncbi:MAG: flavodoxin family protein [Selenomonadaceae bacterium]|nr:flavodoxin family protein [Selenomonadaceae bacterium]
MKKLIAVNGSPRKNWNTVELLKSAMLGAEDAGAESKLIHLYSLNFKGCTSCFACKIKTREHGFCAMKDDLSSILEEIKTADAIIFGSPIYFMNLSAGMLAFLERLFFSNYIYSQEIPSVFPKKLPNAFFLTMNMTAENFERFKMNERLNFYYFSAERILKSRSKKLMAYDTVQFKDYSKYESSIFSEEEKHQYHDETFEKTLEDARRIGRELIQID